MNETATTMTRASGLGGPSVLIIDPGWSQTYLLARDFTRSGLHVFVLGDQSRWRRSMSRCISVVSQSLPSTYDPEAAVATVAQALRESGADWVLPVSNEMLGQLWHVDPPWISQVLPIVPKHERYAYMSKAAMNEIATAAGVEVARTIIVRSIADGDAAVDQFGLPLVIKPDDGFGGNGLMIARTADEVRKRVVASLADDRVALLLQQYVEGPTCLVGGLYRNGTCIGHVAARVDEADPPGIGPSTRLTTLGETALLGCADRLLRALRFDGIAGLDFIKAPDGRFVFLEVNPRPWGSLGLARAAGLDIITQWGKMLQGLEPDRQQNALAGVDWAKMPEYLQDHTRRRRSMIRRAFHPVALRSWAWYDVRTLLWQWQGALDMFKTSRF